VARFRELFEVSVDRPDRRTLIVKCVRPPFEFLPATRSNLDCKSSGIPDLVEEDSPLVGQLEALSSSSKIVRRLLMTEQLTFDRPKNRRAIP
jgi:hypothetical protein